MTSGDTRAHTVVLTGVSGAGRTSAAKVLEDVGYFVVDNLPLGLISRFVDLTLAGDGAGNVALVLDVRSLRGLSHPDGFTKALQVLRRRTAGSRVVFLDASNETLVRRYANKSRSHPLTDRSNLLMAIDREREILAAVRGDADLVIDTSDVDLPELRERLAVLWAGADAESLAVNIVTFGFKNGAPLDADLIFDVRFLPNPHWEEQLRPLTGLDDPVVAYVSRQQETQHFLERLYPVVDFLVAAHERQGRAVLTIAVGCTGGHHRSVTVGRLVHDRLAESGRHVHLQHRDVHLSH